MVILGCAQGNTWVSEQGSSPGFGSSAEILAGHKLGMRPSLNALRLSCSAAHSLTRALLSIQPLKMV